MKILIYYIYRIILFKTPTYKCIIYLLKPFTYGGGKGFDMIYLTSDSSGRSMYYYKPYVGICKIGLNGGAKREDIVCPGGTEKMFVLCDSSYVTHIITAARNNTGFTYMQINNGNRRSCRIGGINGDIEIERVMLGANKIGQSIFYSAVFRGEHILVHCMLGDNAMPETVDKLKNGYFFLHDMKVYYTNENGILGSRDFSDGKPGQLVYNSEGEMPYVRKMGNECRIAYIHDGGVYMNGRRIADDREAENPVICTEKGRNMIVWKSGINIRAALAEHGNKVFTAASGGNPVSFASSNGIDCRYYYGSSANGDIRVFYSDNPFSERNDEDKDEKIKRLEKEVDELKDIIRQMKNSNV